MKGYISLSLLVCLIACGQSDGLKTGSNAMPSAGGGGRLNTGGIGAVGGSNIGGRSGASSQSGSGGTAAHAGGPSAPTAGAGGTNTGRRICDGTTGLRFAASVPWNGPLQDGMGLLFEIGVMYILVSGECQYSTWGSADSALGDWAPMRTGTLSEASERELSESFEYSRWPQMQDSYGPDVIIRDAPSLIVSDGRYRIACHKPCAIEAPILNRALEEMSVWVDRLYDTGQDASGNIRLRVFELERYPGVELVPWNLSQPPRLMLNSETLLQRLRGPATIIEGRADLDALREARLKIAKMVVPGPALTQHEDENLAYGFAFRDQVEFEDENGAISGLHINVDY